MAKDIFTFLAKKFSGKGIDKKFPFIIFLYKKFQYLFGNSGEEEVTIPLNLKLWVSKKDSGLGLFLRSGKKFEPTQTKILVDSIIPGMTIIDIGANVGYYTLLAAKKSGPKGKVFAFEPDPQNYILLKKNIANLLSGIIISPLALSDKIGTVTLNQAIGNPGESSLAGNFLTRKIEVKRTTLDSFCKDHTISQLDLVKIDIEGGEVKALLGGKEILSKSKRTKLFVEINPRALSRFSSSPKELLDLVQSFGFSTKLIIDETNKKILKYDENLLMAKLAKTAFLNIYAEKIT